MGMRKSILEWSPSSDERPETATRQQRGLSLAYMHLPGLFEFVIPPQTLSFRMSSAAGLWTAAVLDEALSLLWTLIEEGRPDGTLGLSLWMAEWLGAPSPLGAECHPVVGWDKQLSLDWSIYSCIQPYPKVIPCPLPATGHRNSYRLGITMGAFHKQIFMEVPRESPSTTFEPSSVRF